LLGTFFSGRQGLADEETRMFIRQADHGISRVSICNEKSNKVNRQRAGGDGRKRTGLKPATMRTRALIIEALFVKEEDAGAEERGMMAGPWRCQSWWRVARNKS